MFKIIDKQIAGREFADGAVFETKEDVRSQLINYHSIDTEPEDMPLLEKMTVEEILDFGDWELKDISHNTE